MKHVQLTKKIKDYCESRNILYYNTCGTQFSIKGWPDVELKLRKLAISIEIKVGNDKLSNAQKSVARKFFHTNNLFYIMQYKKEVFNVFKQVDITAMRLVATKFNDKKNDSFTAVMDMLILDALTQIDLDFTSLMKIKRELELGLKTQ